MQCQLAAVSWEIVSALLSLVIIIIIITKEYDYGGVMSRGLQGHLTNEIVRRESQRDK